MGNTPSPPFSNLFFPYSVNKGGVVVVEAEEKGKGKKEEEGGRRGEYFLLFVIGAGFDMYALY